MVNSHSDWLGLQYWYRNAANSACREAHARLLEAVLPTLLGHTIIALGSPTGVDPLCHSPIQRRFYLDLALPLNRDHVSLLAEPAQLPFSKACIDVAVASHLLEFVAAPEQALSEIERVLAPEGHLVVTGFTPFCPWYLGHATRSQWRQLRRRYPAEHWQGRPLSPTRLRGWLNQQGFDIIALHRERCHLDIAGLGLPASAYAVVAKKRVVTLTPVRLRPRARNRLAVPSLTAGFDSKPAGTQRRSLRKSTPQRHPHYWEKKFHHV